MSPDSATRGLLAADLVILNHGQVTKTTPELASPSPFYTVETGGCLSFDRFNVHRPLQVPWQNCGGGVAIYCPFGEFHRANSYCHLYGAQGLGQRQAYF
ncbi:hypothetical protein TNCV_806211 [Trichonephila clavipes]|nr:hypothetical protein TNCV_806211 [Trichonephila clavipes]